MKFDLNESIDILSRTPAVLETLLSGLSNDWLNNNEGGESWSPYDIVGHLIHGEKTDWIPRMEIILSDSLDKNFSPFDRFAQKTQSKGKSLSELLEEFMTIRKKNIENLKSKNLTASDLTKTGIHPEFGEVTLEQLLATMTVHDLGHIAQISRVMAKQYFAEVGPWKAYLPVLTK
ncbi:MAG: DinB family protein [Ignavibacteria bacterium]|nr:DinB family protein [Ignavibacteria bacterium]